MSLIRLRARLRQRRHRAVSLAVVALVGVLVAAHHGAASESHGEHGAPMTASHAGHQQHEAPMPATSPDAAIVACVAVLPLLALLAAAVRGAAVPRAQAHVVDAIPGRPRAAPRIPEPRARAGPHSLCVMRC